MLSAPLGSAAPANLPPCTFRIELGFSHPADLLHDEKSNSVQLVVEMAPRPVALDASLGAGQWRAQASLYVPIGLRIAHSSAAAALPGTMTPGSTTNGAAYMWDLQATPAAGGAAGGGGSSRTMVRTLPVAQPGTLAGVVWELASFSFDILIDKLAVPPSH